MTYQLWYEMCKIYPRHNAMVARWETLLLYGVLNRNHQCWRIKGTFGKILESIRAMKGWSRLVQHHQQGIIPGKVQVRVHMDQVGSENRKWSIYKPWGQWRASIIHRAVSVICWPHYRFTRRLYSCENCLYATNWHPVPIWHKRITYQQHLNDRLYVLGEIICYTNIHQT